MKTQCGHLLVVDDNEMNRDMLSRRLQRRGHTVAVAAGGRQALEMIESEQFDLVLLDIMMPQMSGLEVLQLLRQDYSVVALPVIMVTAKHQSEDIVEALRLGANDYVTKPIDFPVVNARVQTQLNLKRLSELKDEFLRIASHDLRNPLSGIIGHASLCQRFISGSEPKGEQLRRCISAITDLGRVMQGIVEDFLDFQALEDGQLTLKLAATDLNEIARQVQESNINHAQAKKIELSLALESELSNVNADPARMRQVVENFVTNALKFSPENSNVIIRTRGEKDQVTLEVSDNGPGLTEEDMQKLFVKYARLSAKPTSAEKSSGLGLAICKNIVDMHGGRIGARNNSGPGATFWCQLPIA